MKKKEISTEYIVNSGTKQVVILMDRPIMLLDLSAIKSIATLRSLLKQVRKNGKDKKSI